ncbi:UDP-glucose 4-epimerase-like isoform X2 [Varroa jacobsoni]|nr:UDP-glucose 4-epimerase-like isoform X2 [Varroa destructor]XP_022702463.1 UDP-glucose 4-epimerase-like isoform X2 [Varroa jacobsoni]XP_022702472.1 UDP-glucose 4-epimerase-like isoform X2 [Varroa jacobsoni]
MSPLIFVTGGAGFIGSHCIVELLEAGFDVVAVDNFVNAIPSDDGQQLPESLRRVAKITGKSMKFAACDLCDEKKLEEIVSAHKFDCVIHFAALKAVGQSCIEPLEYYRNNMGSTVALLNTMRRHNMRNIIFSSSATVYGVPEYLPVDEKHPTGMSCTNPYGRTKYFIEEMLKDLHRSEPGWNITLLRYFNPVGAHESGLIGEDPQGEPNNLMPYIAQVAVGRRESLKVFGSDFDTPDGTGVRDYIHVVDLVKGHVAALDKILSGNLKGLRIYNLGASKGYSVLEVIKTFEEATKAKVPYRTVDRRQGDVAALYADASLAAKELNWKAELSLTKMCEDTWRWQQMNPQGFATSKIDKSGQNGLAD